MKFGPRPLEEATGKILAHNLADEDGRRLLRKGTILEENDLDRIRDLGRTLVYVAEVEDGDLLEDLAAHRLAQAAAGEGLHISAASTGRANLKAKVHGVLRVDPDRLRLLNEAQGVTLATLPTDSVVQPRQMVATVKIVPYAIPETTVTRIEEQLAGGPPVLEMSALRRRSVALILQGSARVQERLHRGFAPPLQERIEAWGSELVHVEYVVLQVGQEIDDLAAALRGAISGGAELVLLAGETAIMDSDDIIPAAIRHSGGHVESVGAPVDPGNLLMLAYLDEVPVLGAPGCARSRKENVVDWIIPRLLAGERLTRADLVQLGHGGLLAEIMDRPMPREAGGAG